MYKKGWKLFRRETIAGNLPINSEETNPLERLKWLKIRRSHHKHDKHRQQRQ
jgi:hypothetical protein